MTSGDANEDSTTSYHERSRYMNEITTPLGVQAFQWDAGKRACIENGTGEMVLLCINVRSILIWGRWHRKNKNKIKNKKNINILILALIA